MTRILVIQSRTILVAGLKSLLQRMEGIEVMSCSIRSGKALKGKVNAYRPDVIILDASLGKTLSSTILASLEAYPQICLLVINMENCEVQIYEKRNLTVECVEDLVDVIRGQSPG